MSPSFIAFACIIAAISVLLRVLETWMFFIDHSPLHIFIGKSRSLRSPGTMLAVERYSVVNMRRVLLSCPFYCLYWSILRSIRMLFVPKFRRLVNIQGLFWSVIRLIQLSMYLIAIFLFFLALHTSYYMIYVQIFKYK